MVTARRALSAHASGSRKLALTKPEQPPSTAAIASSSIPAARPVSRSHLAFPKPGPVAKLVQHRSVTSLGKTQGRLVIIGSGWAGYKLLRNIDTRNYEVVCVSPRNYFLFTPLLASSAVGTLEHRAIIEPVRQFNKPLQFHQASCDSIDFDKKVIHCTSRLEDNNKNFTLAYDKLIIAPGAHSNTFGIEGVQENAVFLKDIADARRIRSRVIECFEHAMQPGTTEEEQLALLHFQVVGGGPTGVEFSAELFDFVTEDLRKLYPSLMPKVQITLYDVAPRILGAFDASLSSEATKRFMRRGIKVRTGTRVAKVEPGTIVLASGERVPFGLLVWATGITQTPLVRSLADRLMAETKGLGRIVTDDNLRALKPDGTPLPDVFALGDCAMIKGSDLPATAQVANQKAVYLAKQLNKPEAPMQPFAYKHLGSMAYIGGWRAVADISKEFKPSGWGAWVFWRSAYLTMSVSWRNKALIPMFWFLAWAFGRDVSRFR
ncbi:pyridine nucleotide-disulfide oxidoreductase-domain-containing protein [Catenaria anguillulae PL171]|uniref:Pyridine nucleotide-disulfide oxidoreductase-domain-containing protein n=1 Tax=Catenaria anguillulae PL171 TaxID=765915 RepID=A0A1Y2I0L0_9FUNG|nr:pyridine nucleotide-disulfide oxidoreductase-domain-containing protein [Catenaria anguillulae PL171]